MKILVLNGSYRPEGTTTELARAFMEGAQSEGAEGEMIMLRDRESGYCTNCLQCYSYRAGGDRALQPAGRYGCDHTEIAEAAGGAFTSPVLWARFSWLATRPAGLILGSMSIESHPEDKARTLGSIASAGGMSEYWRR